MTRFPIADLHFAYRDDRPKLCYELHGLADDEIEVLLEAMQRRFDQSEPDAFTFSIKTSDDYSPLERVKRRRGGDWADSDIEGPGQRFIAAIDAECKGELTDDQRRWLDVRNTAWSMTGEINRLRVELNCHEPVKSSVLATISREELLAHLDEVEYSPPKLPAMRHHPHADKIEQVRRGMDAFHDQQRQYEAGLERVSRAVQDVAPISETMKQAYLDAMAEHEQSKPARSELESLVKLAERKLWPVDELPADIDADVLRCLDERGWVEARYVIMQNQARYPGDPTPPSPSPGGWDSPLKRPSMVGSWDSFLAKRERNERDHPGEVRVSEIGKAILARVRREVAALPERANSSTENAEPTHSPDFTSVDWFGTRYTFAKGNQAQAVRVLWEAWAKGEHSLSQETVGERIESSADRFEMRKTFRRRKTEGKGYEPHPAWGTMIQQYGKGCFRLVRPESD